MRASVDKEKCIGCGLCSSECPAVFALTDDNVASVAVPVVPAEQKECCRRAAANCPVDAIEISD